nr:hypothetical protein [Tanacetum cinerariifolium]
MNVRKFSGDDPERWIFAITEYFSLLNTLVDQRLRIVSFNLEGVAAEWFRLKLHLQRELLASKPLTLGYVFLLARMIEARLEDSRSTTTIAKPKNLVQVQHLEETTFHKSNKVKETKARVESIVHKEKATTEKEKTIKETSDTFTSLQSEVASHEAKRSLDANEKVKKSHTRVHGLEKQEEELPMELQLNNNFKEALDTKGLKKMIDLNPMLHDLQEVKTKCALKINDGEFKKAKSEATRLIRKLTKVYDAWLPPWIASRLVVYQPYVKNHWK